MIPGTLGSNPYVYDPSQPVNTGVGQIVWMSTGGEDRVLAGSPALELIKGRVVWLVNRGPKTLHLQDRTSRATSKLWLKYGSDRTLQPWDSVQLACDGYRWVEL
jgi:hypothetical protein